MGGAMTSCLPLARIVTAADRVEEALTRYRDGETNAHEVDHAIHCYSEAKAAAMPGATESSGAKMSVVFPPKRDSSGSTATTLRAIGRWRSGPVFTVEHLETGKPRRLLYPAAVSRHEFSSLPLRMATCGSDEAAVPHRVLATQTYL
jgi:hypothetical protein